MIKYDKVKQVRTDRENLIVLISDIYDRHTGEFAREEETMIDADIIAERIVKLQDEIVRLEALQVKIINDDFDVVEDKREKKDDRKAEK